MSDKDSEIGACSMCGAQEGHIDIYPFGLPRESLTEGKQQGAMRPRAHTGTQPVPPAPPAPKPSGRGHS